MLVREVDASPHSHPASMGQAPGELNKFPRPVPAGNAMRMPAPAVWRWAGLDVSEESRTFRGLGGWARWRPTCCSLGSGSPSLQRPRSGGWARGDMRMRLGMRSRRGREMTGTHISGGFIGLSPTTSARPCFATLRCRSVIPLTVSSLGVRAVCLYFAGASQRVCCRTKVRIEDGADALRARVRVLPRNSIRRLPKRLRREASWPTAFLGRQERPVPLLGACANVRCR